MGLIEMALWLSIALVLLTESWCNMMLVPIERPYATY